MSAKLLSGRLPSDFLLTQLHREVKKIKRKGLSPKLVIILVGKNPASLSYIRQKTLAAEKIGIQNIQKNFNESVKTEELVKVIEQMNRDKTVHGILVQLPLPKHISVPLVTGTIDAAKDVDGFEAYNLGKMFLSSQFEDIAPCTPAGIIRLLEFYKISPAEKSVTVVGRSNTVGKPVAVMLLNRDATVTVCHSKTKNLAKYTKAADILIAAVGKTKMITADMVKRGAVVIDVGITKVENKLIGDVDFESVRKKASWITPVPGGVGPMTVACLMENVVHAAKRLTTLNPTP